jgi:hypothetical protein
MLALTAEDQRLSAPPETIGILSHAWNSECCFELFASQQEIISKGHNGNGRAKTSLRQIW